MKQLFQMKVFGVVIMLLLISNILVAGDQQALWIKANRDYAAGSYSDAAEGYGKIVAGGYESPALFFNLGNSYFKMNDYARAILWFERAKRLDPGNEDIDFNLKVANTKISDKIEALPELFYKRWFYALVLLYPADTWAIAGILLMIGGLALLVLYIASRVIFLRKTGFWGGSGLITASIITFALAWTGYRYVTSSSDAVILSPTITVKSSPDDRGTDIFVVHEGTKVRLLDRIGDWYEIRIANGSVGWLRVESLEKI
jgi:tetratricopeptide (TPR) repeat protein